MRVCPLRLRATIAVSLGLLAGPRVIAQEPETDAANPQARARLARLEDAVAAAQRTGGASQSRAYLVDYPLARLKARIADFVLSNANRPWLTGGRDADTELREGFAALDLLAQGKAADQVKGGRLELAYECDVDGTAQPFYVFLPPKYDPARPTPLVVFLHGYVPEITIADPWVPSETEFGAAGDLGAIFMVPYGRRNTDFVAVGEVDVLDAIRATERLYRIDPDRVYLMGVSMGGYGTWNIGLRHPQEFAALGPVSGQADMAAWLRRPFDQMPWWKVWQYQWDNPIELADNAVAIPSHLMWGALDALIPVQHGRMLVQRLKDLDAPVTYVEVPDESHYVYWGPLVYDTTMNWFADQRRDLWPRHVRYRTWSLRYDTAYWVTINQFEEWGRDALIDVRVQPDQRIEVQTTNVAAYTLTLNDRLLDPAKRFVVTTNGKTSFEGTLSDDAPLTVHLDDAYVRDKANGLWKRKGLCGPIEDAYNYPFMVVRGVGEAATAADRFADEWDLYADGKPRIRDASKVTDADIARYNLVLFGRPGENAVTKRIADRLPIKFDGDAFVVAGRKFNGDNVGAAFIYPNPLNPERYVVVQAGPLWGQSLDINHKFDLMPDFIIYNDEIEKDKTDHALCAGFFDRRWQLSDKLTWTPEE